MQIELTCSHCDRLGSITAIQDFHPDSIFCGHCKKEFDYIPTVWEHLDDLNDEVNATGMFYMVPANSTEEALVQEEGEELHALEWLLTLPLKYVVYSYKKRWRRGMPSRYGVNHNPPYDNIRLTYGPRWEEFPSEVIKGYLDEQAHVGKKGPVPRGREDRAVPTIRQGRLSYSQMKQIAQREGTVEWTKTKTREKLIWKDGHIRAFKLEAPDEKGHCLRRHDGAYFCKEVT